MVLPKPTPVPGGGLAGAGERSMAVVAPATKRPDTEEAFGRMVAAEL